MNQSFIHPLSDVQSTAIGVGTRVWQFVVVLPGAQIGQDCNICSHCLVENDVVVGDRVTVKSGVQLWDGSCVAEMVTAIPTSARGRACLATPPRTARPMALLDSCCGATRRHHEWYAE